MKVFPAIDIIEGKCVRLTKGLADQKTIYENSPVEMAKLYQDTGFNTIHVVDLDSTLGNGNNDKVLKDIRNNVDIKIEVAGGIRSKESIDNKINEGFDIIVIGTFAIKNINEVLQFDDVILNKLSIALDIKDNQIASHGWQQTATTSLNDIIDQYNKKNIHSSTYHVILSKRMFSLNQIAPEYIDEIRIMMKNTKYRYPRRPLRTIGHNETSPYYSVFPIEVWVGFIVVDSTCAHAHTCRFTHTHTHIYMHTYTHLYMHTCT